MNDVKEHTMFLELPYDLQENIYHRLDAKNRIKMRIALPKATKLYNSLREKKLAVTSNYIRKHRNELIAKRKSMSPSIIEFLKSHESEPYIKQYCDEFNIHKDLEIDCVLSDIKNNQVKIDHKYTIIPVNARSMSDALAMYGTSETFLNLYKNQSTRTPLMTLIKSDYDFNSFMFGLFNYKNEGLIQYILQGDYEFKEEIEPFVSTAKSYVESPSIASIFASSCKTMQLIIKYLHPSKSTLDYILDKAEESFNIDTCMLLMNMI